MDVSVSISMYIHTWVCLCVCSCMEKHTHLPHQFSVNFGYTIDGSRPLDTEVRSRVTGRRWPKGSDGAGDKETQAVLQGQIQHVMKAWRDSRKVQEEFK